MPTADSTVGGTRNASHPLVTIQGLKKTFGGTQALKGVDMTVRSGEMHGLLGPNGAGKSTLIKILAGIHRPDGGTVEVRSYDREGPGKISVIHQDLGLVDILSVRENFHLSREGGIKRARFLIDHRRERKIASQWLAAVNLDIDPDTPIAELGLGEKSLVAVARLLAQKADVLILDEITAALTRK
jgi:ribose transport system ATP-binding protein